MKTETRIRYDDLQLKYNPHDEVYPWELWVDGQCEASESSPRELFEAWAFRIEFAERYTGSDGEPSHQRYPDDYENDEEEVLATPPMVLEHVPSQEVQATFWDALKASDEPFHLRDFCDATGAEYAEVRHAVSLFSAHGLVEWGVSANVPWLTPEGKALDQPEWFATDVNTDTGIDAMQDDADRSGVE